MTHISRHDLWGNRNSVVTLAPCPDSVFAITTVGGQAVSVQPVHQFESVVRTAHGFARRVQATRPVTIKVLCLTLGEAVLMGFVVLPDEGCPYQAGQDRQLVIGTMMQALAQSNEPQVRADAIDILKQMGAIPK